ncbi:MAG: LysR family transcriptional regulator [Moraxellaceae bacterium]|nr:MAG: LysR family transcriptional regulator [Moraxellaceae bacterium]
MHLSKIDLNLFMVFDAIYAHSSITKAAGHLNLTQPAVSHALGRLRNAFGDELFVRSGRKMVPTPVAKSMIETVQIALAQLEKTLVDPLSFDPLQTTKHVVLGMRDVVESVFLPRLVSCLQVQAPHLTLSSIRIPRQDMESELAAGSVDIAFDVLLPIKAEIEHAPLLADKFAIVVRKGHPLTREKLTLKRYLSYSHIVVSSRRGGVAAEDFELSRQGIRRNIALRCQHYFVARQVVRETDMILTVPEGYALNQQSLDDTVVLPLPVNLPSLEIHMYWHKTVANDPANAWLRELLLHLANDKRQARSEK